MNVPQGPVLSLLLFNIFTAHLLKTRTGPLMVITSHYTVHIPTRVGNRNLNNLHISDLAIKWFLFKQHKIPGNHVRQTLYLFHPFKEQNILYQTTCKVVIKIFMFYNFDSAVEIVDVVTRSLDPQCNMGRVYPGIINFQQ